MAITTIPGGGFMLPPQFPGNMAPSYVSRASMSVANGKIGFIFHAPRTGNVTAVTWRTQTVTTGATIDVRLETVDNATGAPTGTLVGTTTNVAVAVNAADDNVVFTSTLTAAAAVTAGQCIALVLANPGASFGNMAIAGYTYTGAAWPFPYGMTHNGTSWNAAFTAGLLQVALLYDDGAYTVPHGGSVPSATIAGVTNFDTGTTPDVMGLRFKFPTAARVTGAWVTADMDADALIAIVTTAYNQGAGTGILASVAMNEFKRGVNGSGNYFVTFDAPVDLAASTYYRLIVEPTTTTASDVKLNYLTFGSLALLAANPGGADFHLTSAKNPTADGDWTNYNSGTFAVPFMGLLIDGWETPTAPSSGSGGSYAFVG